MRAIKLLVVLVAMSATRGSAGPGNSDFGHSHHGSKGGSYGAPEPGTIAALAVGGAAVAYAAWRIRKKR